MKFTLQARGFKRDSKLVVKRGYDIFKLDEIIQKLKNDEPLPAQCRPHLLQGRWKGHWECHIAPDWLLIYKIFNDYIELVRTGTHTDLFG